MKLLSRIATIGIVVAGICVGMGSAFPAEDQASPQVPCADKNAALNDLQSRFGERPIWDGASNDNMEMMITENADNGTWSMLLINGDNACMVAAGTHSTREGGTTL